MLAVLFLSLPSPPCPNSPPISSIQVLFLLPLDLLVYHRIMADSVEQAANISAERRRIHREVRHMVDTGRIQEEEEHP